MGSYQIGMMKGDGIGPEIVESTVAVLDAASKYQSGLIFDWHEFPMGWDGIRAAGDPLSEDTLKGLEDCDAWILGPHDSVSYPDDLQEELNPSGKLRAHFDLFANIRPARTYPSVPSAAKDTDLVIVRENTEGFYTDRNMFKGIGDFMPTEDVAVAVGVFSRKAIERIARVGFEMARSRRKKVSLVHKANVIKVAHGLYLDACRDVAKDFPDVEVEDYHIDAMTAHLVRRSADFDVIVATNMFGDILSDLTGELVGSLGMAGSVNAGDERAMAQAVHGAAPDIAGKGIANPLGMVNSAILLLDWLGTARGDSQLTKLSKVIEQAVADVLTSGPLPRDLGGKADTCEFTQAILNRLNQE